MHTTTKRLLLGVSALAVLAAGYYGYRKMAVQPGDHPASRTVSRPVQAQLVLAVKVVRKAVLRQLTAVGTVQPVESVAVHPRLDSQITRVFIQEGQHVNAGDALFALDARQIQALSQQARAMLARDEAQLGYARRALKRLDPKIESQAKIDQARTNVTALEAGVRADQANVDSLKVQLSYTAIRAPITGRVGGIAYKVGSTVRAGGQTPLVTINRMRPIYVSFSVAQQHLPALRAAMNAGAVAVSATVPGDAGPDERGRVVFLDNAIDTATGSIAVKARFDNPKERLWPGAFVNVVLTLGRQANALVIPEQAVQISQSGSLVFVILPGMTVESRPVVVSRTVGGEAVIDRGLKEGEQVVERGQQRLVNGTRVQIQQPQPGSK